MAAPHGVLERQPSTSNGLAGPAIRAQGLVKTYPGDVRALDGLSISVEAGTVFGLLGPNGAGKSTAVKILTTLSRPDGGSASVAGIDVLGHPNQIRRVIGCVTQKSAIDIQATGEENMLLQGRVYGLSGRALNARIDELLGRFGLADVAKRFAKTYSGGTRRKLDVAMGLIHRPQVLFLDEPTTGLDPEARAEMWTEITRLTSEDGLTVLLTTHYLEEADRLAQQLAIVDKGRVVVTGSPDALKNELRGDAIHVELSQSAGLREVARVLERVSGVGELVVDERSVHARADNGAAAVPAVLSALDAAGLAVTSVTVSRPSLDDVYLRYVGRRFAGSSDLSEVSEPNESNKGANR